MPKIPNENKIYIYPKMSYRKNAIGHFFLKKFQKKEHIK